MRVSVEVDLVNIYRIDWVEYGINTIPENINFISVMWYVKFEIFNGIFNEKNV